MKIFNDKNLINTALNQLYRLISGPMMLLFIPLFLTQEEQGYWYTFTSLAALAIFADLGFSTIILQFAAHEFAFLKFKDNGEIEGDYIHLRKLADFFRFSVKWLIIIVSIVFPLIILYGFYFIGLREDIDITWKIPWLIYAFSSAIVFIYSSLLYFFEGCNSVAKVEFIRFKVSVITSIILLLGLFFKIKLYALALSLLISFLYGLYMLYKNFNIAMKQLWDISRVQYYSWKKEIFNLIWKYALSWCSGYFIFQIFVPLSFNYYDATFAGKIGLSNSIWTAIMSISNIFIVSKMPYINMLVSKKLWIELDRILKNIFLKLVGTYILGMISFFLLYYILYNKLFIFQRLLDLYSMLILSICWFLQLIVSFMATYLRAHKKEPLMYISIFCAVYVSISTFFIVNNFPSDYLFLGFLTSFIFVLPTVMYIFYLQRKEDYKIR
ncbi:hypothetical protein H5995_05440 [Megamonas rupellensis]|uniref:hypothetical protein n=1 Tax=Megamonas rupellensis TaxID=491921 RepID=UPI001958BC0D|nr:hypothetical protein [Megamonas rupellensis]MBM6748723.1 hypothetical protein [Megamonas rupellensis]